MPLKKPQIKDKVGVKDQLKSNAEKASKNGIPSPLTLEQLFAPNKPDDVLADKLVKIAQQQIQTSNQYKRNRMQEVQKSIDLYDGKTKKALKGRYNVPIPMMPGYIDTLVSKIDDPPKVNFGYNDIADMQRSQKVQAKFDEDSGSTQGQWDAKDRLCKKIASFYGVGIYKYFAYNDDNGAYQSVLEIVDPLDFECEPLGGQFLNQHKFMGQRNIFKTEADLDAGAIGDSPIYNKKQLLRLKFTCNSNDYKDFKKLFVEKTDRLKSLGFNPELNSYMGQKVYNLTEWFMEYNGEWYYLLMEPHSGVWIRFEKLTDVFKSGKRPFVAWHTNPDPFNFWSKAPADDMRPIAESVNIVFNQMLDYREKVTYKQRAYDPEVFTDPAQLEWRPDGLVEANTDSGARSIGSGIYEFNVSGMTEAGSINLISFMDNFVGTKTGITPSAQGDGNGDKTNGIYFGNLQQVADRLGLYNKSYSEAWAQIGFLYYWGLKEHIKNNRMMVKMIGATGYNWVELSAEDTNPNREFDIRITGGQSEAQQDALKKKQRNDTLSAIVANPNLGSRLNPEVTIEEFMRNGSFSEDTIKRILNKDSFGSDEIVSEAHKAIQEILQGKVPKRNRGATPLYIQTIIDFAADSEDLDDATFKALNTFAESHIETAAFNMVRKANMDAMIISMAQAQSVQNNPAGQGNPPPKQNGGSPAPKIDMGMSVPGGAKEMEGAITP